MSKSETPVSQFGRTSLGHLNSGPIPLIGNLGYARIRQFGTAQSDRVQQFPVRKACLDAFSASPDDVSSRKYDAVFRYNHATAGTVATFYGDYCLAHVGQNFSELFLYCQKVGFVFRIGLFPCLRLVCLKQRASGNEATEQKISGNTDHFK